MFFVVLFLIGRRVVLFLLEWIEFVVLWKVVKFCSRILLGSLV